MYNTIKKKTCKCGCGRMPSLSMGGFYYACAPEEVRAKFKSKKDLQIKAVNARKYASTKLRMTNYKEDKELEFWFKSRMSAFQPICENCGAQKSSLLLPLFESKWKSCQAHLLPKRHFKSIRAHPLNGLVLGSGYSGMCYCHDSYDSNWDAASKMWIWKEVVRRFLILYPLIAESERKHIPEVLMKPLHLKL